MLPIDEWQALEKRARPNLKALLGAPVPRADVLTLPGRGIGTARLRAPVKSVYLLDTDVVSELRRLNLHPRLVRCTEQVAAYDSPLSWVADGEIQAGIEFTRKQDVAEGEKLEAWLSTVQQE